VRTINKKNWRTDRKEGPPFEMNQTVKKSSPLENKS